MLYVAVTTVDTSLRRLILRHRAARDLPALRVQRRALVAYQMGVSHRPCLYLMVTSMNRRRWLTFWLNATLTTRIRCRVGLSVSDSLHGGMD